MQKQKVGFLPFLPLLALMGLLAGTLAAAANSTVTEQRVGDFALLDQHGKFHQLSWYGDQKAIVVVAHGNNDADLQAGASALNALQKQHAEQGVEFFLLNPLLADNRTNIAKEAAKAGYSMPVLVDEAQLVAESLGLTRVGEAVLINPADMTVSWRGGVAGLAAALGDNAAASVPATGAMIKFASRETHAEQQVSYTKDIVPILVDNCVSCHHDGAIAPWSMSSHAMVRGWSPMMREVLMTQRMPPGQIDLHVGKPIAGVAGLTDKEKQRLVHWIDAGSPIDGDVDPLTKLTFNDPKFTLGEPDVVVKVPAQEIPATGVLDYRYVPVELNLDRDVWIRALEFVPGDRAVLHHIITYLSSPADKKAPRNKNGDDALGENVGGFAPGRGPEQFRDNSGRLVTKGSNLLLQMHYTTSGKPAVDETEIGLYLYDKPPQYVMGGGVAGQRRFFVPAHEPEYKLRGEQEIERDAYLYSMNPHMHYRGRYMKYTAEYPDGTSEVLLSVPKYDFNWQFNYQLEEPLFLPAGTKLVATGAMDNSARNKANPDPSKPVHYGLQTKHEMFFGFTTLRYVGDTPASVRGLATAEDKEAAQAETDVAKVTPVASGGD